MSERGQDRLAAAAQELYGGEPEEFTGRRAELVAAARTAGDRDAARAIGALRRPTRSAWVVNRLARADPSAPPKLAELAEALRAAQQARQGLRLRELSAARGALVDSLTARALALAGLADPPPQLRLEVTQTLTAALADPGTAADFAAGRLARAVQWSGFGVLPADNDASADAGDAGAGQVTGASRRTGRSAGRKADAKGADAGAADAEGADDQAKRPARRGGQAAPSRRARGAGTGSARPLHTVPQQAKRASRRPEADQREQDDARRQAEAAERLAQQMAELAAGRRTQIAEAERAVATAAQVAASAVAAEDALEVEVRDLEGRLDRTRADARSARVTGARW